ncbi:hypothetical protein [Brevundimonas sp.]|uniref:hypothetical protein n=1 Tax=Brevundimonas sp. TaxID=1871086 RepID=UPI0028AC6BB5|nr:hypothetical protein [Brevundimonas sp.]
MAETVAAAAAAVASWVSSTVFVATGSAAIATTAYISAYAVTAVGITAGVSMGLTAIAKASVPDPEGQKITRKQTRPPRVRAVGWDSRMSGPYMLRETVGNKYGAVIALCDDRLEQISRVYLNDDRVTLGAAGWVAGMANERYGTGDLVNISLRLGNPVETRHTNLDPTFSSYWPANARGDGVASLAVFAQHRSKESFPRHFPNGEVIPSVVGRPVCYDWRDPSQSRTNPATWKACANPVVWLVHLEWAQFGRSWDRCIAPALADLTVEANYCDQPVPLRAGGTEPRYRIAGNYPVNTEPAAIRAAILASMDGWLSVNGKGHLIIKAGRYVEPTLTITGEHIEGYSWRAFQTDEEAINELIVSYVSPDHDFTEIEAGAWRDEADISATGRLRSEPLGLTWVYSRAQAMRLAKRKMTRLNAPRRGQVRTGIYGLNGLGERYIRVQNPELSSMADVVCEVMNVEIDFTSSQVVFDVIQADVNIDAWNPAEEEGELPAPIVRPEPEALPQPSLISAIPYPTDNGARIRITVGNPNRPDISYRVRWREVSMTWLGYVTEEPTPWFSGSTVEFSTGIVPTGAMIEIGVAFVTSAPGPYAETFVNIPAQITEAARTPAGRDAITITADKDTITIGAFDAYMGDGQTISIPAGTITGLASSTRWGVFWRSDLGFQAEEHPAAVRMTTGQWIFLGWVSTSDAGGSYPTPPPPPPGWGGSNGNEMAVLV